MKKTTPERYFYGYRQSMLHEVRSVTKSVTCCLIGIAKDRKLIGSLHEKIAQYFPGLKPNAGWDKDVANITIKHLLIIGVDFFIVIAGARVVEAASLYIRSAPTEAQTNAALWVAEGNTILGNIWGSVGIGTARPSEKLDVVGSVLADAYFTLSSRRWKKNIEPISDALLKVQRLQGIEYDWKADGKHDIGLIAEEVGEVIPEIVAYEENGVDAKSVAYDRLVALLIEAVKEQQKVIDAQNSEIIQIKAENAEIKKTMAQFSSTLQKLEALVAVEKNVDQTIIELE